MSDPTKHTIIPCRQCGARFEAWISQARQFCSVSCASMFSRRAASVDPRKRVTARCTACGSGFEHQGGPNRRYCPDCQQIPSRLRLRVVHAAAEHRDVGSAR